MRVSGKDYKLEFDNTYFVMYMSKSAFFSKSRFLQLAFFENNNSKCIDSLSFSFDTFFLCHIS